jgi:hypothetical protein
VVTAQGSARGAVNGASLTSQSGTVGATAAANITITATQAQLLKQLHRLHGLSEPLTVSKTARTAGALVQEVVDSGGVVAISTTSPTTDYPIDVGLLIEELAALHALTVPLTVSNAGRSAGSVQQVITNDGTSTTVTRIQ